MKQEERQKMIQESRRQAFYRKHLKITYVLAAVISGGAWALYLMKVAFGIDIIAHTTAETGNPRDDINSTPVLLGVAIGFTLIAGLWALHKVRKLKALASRGVKGQGTVVSCGTISRRGLTTISIQYTVDGQNYKIRKDMPSGLHPVGSFVDIFYDPQKPRRAEVM